MPDHLEIVVDHARIERATIALNELANAMARVEQAMSDLSQIFVQMTAQINTQIPVDDVGAIRTLMRGLAKKTSSRGAA